MKTFMLNGLKEEELEGVVGGYCNRVVEEALIRTKWEHVPGLDHDHKPRICLGYLKLLA